MARRLWELSAELTGTDWNTDSRQFRKVSIRPVHQSVRPSPIFLVAIVAITAVGGVLAWMAAAEYEPLAYVGVFTFVIAGWIMSLSLHEFAHAHHRMVVWRPRCRVARRPQPQPVEALESHPLDRAAGAHHRHRWDWRSPAARCGCGCCS